MNNKYSVGALTALVAVVLLSLLEMVISCFIFPFLLILGIPPLLVGLYYIIRGFKTLNDSPREVGLMSFLGVKKLVKVEGIVFLFKPFGFKIVDVVIINMQKEDLDFVIENILCNDNGIVEGSVSIAIRADEQDDLPGTPNWMSGTQKLNNYDDAKRALGIESILKDSVVSWVQLLGEHNDSVCMSVRSIEIAQVLAPLILGSNNANPYDVSIARLLGFRIDNLEAKLKRHPFIIAAEQKELITGVMNRRIGKRAAYYRSECVPIDIPTIRKDLIEEDLATEKLIKEVRGGGKNINLNS